MKVSKKKWAGIIVGGLIAIGWVGSLLSPDTKADTASAAASTSSSSSAPVASIVTGKLRGHFDRDCFACGDLKQYIRVSDAWCGWRDDKVIVHVRMTNRSVEHITVNWHPSYTVAGGSDHGTGLSSLEDSGFDAGEVRVIESEQSPEGVYPGAELSDCKPSFYLVESG